MNISCLCIDLVRIRILIKEPIEVNIAISVRCPKKESLPHPTFGQASASNLEYIRWLRLQGSASTVSNHFEDESKLVFLV